MITEFVVTEPVEVIKALSCIRAVKAIIVPIMKQERRPFKIYRSRLINKATFTQIIFMSSGNKKVAKGPSKFKDAVTGKTYKRMSATENRKALNAVKAYAVANPKKQFYA